MPKKKRGKGFKERLDARVRKLDHADIKLIKLSTATFVFFLLTVWPWFKEVIFGVHWGFWLGITIVVMLRPLIRYFST